jgi:hypothetical protein
MPLAKAIIAPAQVGERDPERLCGRSLLSRGLAQFRSWGDAAPVKVLAGASISVKFRPNRLHCGPYFVRHHLEDECTPNHDAVRGAFCCHRAPRTLSTIGRTYQRQARRESMASARMAPTVNDAAAVEVAT